MERRLEMSDGASQTILKAGTSGFTPNNIFSILTPSDYFERINRTCRQIGEAQIAFNQAIWRSNIQFLGSFFGTAVTKPLPTQSISEYAHNIS
jgi:hypothetical protein